MTSGIRLGVSALALALAAVLQPAGAAGQAPITASDIASLVQPATATTTVSVFATGLNNPRGLKFGPDGYLYVAEGGIGGTFSTAGRCKQVIPPVGPYTGSRTGGRISRIGPHGGRTTVTNRLPSSQTSPDLGSLVSGVADIAFIGNTMYALTSGGGCSHGVVRRPNGVVRIGADGSLTLVANLSAFQKANPVQHPEEDDFEPDGTWWNMVAWNGTLYAVEPNHGELDRISTTGAIHRIADISASQGHIVPTALAVHNGDFFVGNLNTFPIVDGSSRVLKITPAGHVTTSITNLTTVLGVQFDKLGRMYVLENTTGGNQNPTPGTGTILRVHADGSRETIATGLTLPTGMTFGPDGDIFVSNVGFGFPPGMGQVLRIHMAH